jgi:hypothetical protein
MVGVIKGVLKEELGNSEAMKKSYERELKKLPPGNIAIKKIKGNFYAYRVKIEGKYVKFIYVGKSSKEKYDEIVKAKEVRAKYKNLLSRAKKQVRYLKGALRGKEEI